MSSLGSEGEDEVGLWSLELQDCQESVEKTSLTPSEGTGEPGSPVRSARPHSLSPSSRNYWGQVEPDAEAAEDATPASIADREGEQEPLKMYCKFCSTVLTVLKPSLSPRLLLRNWCLTEKAAELCKM